MDTMSRKRILGASGLVLMLILAGCSSGSAESADSANPTTIPVVLGQAPSQDVVAAVDGGVDHAVADLSGVIDKVMGDTGIPGMAVAVVHNGEVVFSEGYGVRKMGEPEQVDQRTVFQIASLSKPVGATVVATEVSRGTVSWDTPVVKVMPDFKLSDPAVTSMVTVGDFYSHRSGLPMAAGDSLEDVGFDRSEVLKRLAQVPLLPFRTTYKYANFGITAGAEAVAAAAGTPWEELSQRDLYGPLGMTDTSSSYADFLTRENRAALHAISGETFAPLYQRDPDPQSPAGGVSSSVADLAQWMRMVLGEGTVDGKVIMDSEALMPAISAQTITGQVQAADQRASTYGFGFNVGTQPGGRVAVGHSGAFTQGAGATVSMNPSLDLGIVVLTNAAPVGGAESIVAEFMDTAQFGHTTREWGPAYNAVFMSQYFEPEGELLGKTAPASPAPSTPIADLAGVYASDYYGDAVVEVVDGGLSVKLGPEGAYVVPLTHWDGDVFTFIPTGENSPDGSVSMATFAPGPVGGSTLRLEFFDKDGLGVWTR